MSFSGEELLLRMEAAGYHVKTPDDAERIRGTRFADSLNLVPVGHRTVEGDVFFDGYGIFAVHKEYIGDIITDEWQPVFRYSSVTVETASKWSCGHGREPDDKCCCVCIVFHRSVTS